MSRLPYVFNKLICFQRLANSTHFTFNKTSPFYTTRSFTLHSNGLLQQQKSSSGSGKSHQGTQKKPKLSPKITLIQGQNQAMSVTSLEEAQKMAKRRDLHLLLVQEMDSKTQRPVYKLATSAEMLAEELEDLKIEKPGAEKGTVHKKSQKTLTIGSRISDHDLASRQKNICKWLTKQHEVRILLQGSADDQAKMERIYKAIEQSIKEPELLGKIQQKQIKGSHIKFSIIPIISTNANEGENSAMLSPTLKSSSKTA